MHQIRHQVPLLTYNTFGIPAMASVFVESDDIQELGRYLRTVPDTSRILVLGGGSNILFISAVCDTVIHPVFKGVEVIDESDGQVRVRAGAGEVWDDFVRWCSARDYAGVENLTLIPGMVGACPIQNIGAYGVEVKDVIDRVEAIEISTGQEVIFNNEQCQFGYRDSFFKRNKGQFLITAVWFCLSVNFIPNIRYADVTQELSRRQAGLTIENVRQAVSVIRERKLPDPAVLGNAGSFFKNPTVGELQYERIMSRCDNPPVYPAGEGKWKVSAAWMIQECGWKGVRSGNVGTHQNQPLVIVNYGNATGREIIDFAGRIIDSVESEFGIRLEPEVNMV